MKRVKLFEEYALGEKKITLDWDDDETSIVFSDGEVAQVDYDGDFKYRGEWFSTADHTSGDDLIKDLQKRFKKDRFEWAFESSELKENRSSSNEFIIDKISKEPIFLEGEKLSVREFLTAVKNSPEAQKNIKSGVNFGKGVAAVKYLNKNLPVKLAVRVSRSPWNHGGGLVLRITVENGLKYPLGSPFSYHSGYGSESPTYFVGEYFKGMPHPDSGKPINPNNYYGSYKSISNHQGMLKDIVAIFKAWEEKHGARFGLRTSKLSLNSIKENKSPKLKPTDKTIRQHINQYSVSDDPYDVASEIGKKYGWNESDIEKAERIIRKKYIR